MSSPSDPLLERQRLGDFEVLRQLGRGGMGVVYEARQLSLNRRVALKVLATGIGLTSKAVQRFHREAEAAARLHHTNIVPIYAIGEEGGTLFYAMELVEGPSLDHVIRQLRQRPADASAPPTQGEGSAATAPGTTGPFVPGPGPPAGFGLSPSSLSSGGGYFDAVARLVTEVADALEYANGQGVIHRDVKPSNLLVSPAGRLSLTDFGLARLLEQPGMTISGEIVGTPAYMSPEQVTAGRIPVDHRTDVYSLGATFYELLTLHPPFVGEQRDQVLAQVIQKEPARPRKVNARVPIDLETICLKAMDKDPDRRYQTAGAMADDLRRYVNRFAIQARRAGPLTHLWKWVKRNPALSAALAGVLLCAAIAGGLGYQAYLGKQKLLDEKRRAALEMAMAMAYVQNFDEANKAIREAEGLHCSAGQLRMLRGQLALYQGRTEEAIDHLTRATVLLPESVAARSMLAVAYANAGQFGEYYRELAEAVRLTPATAEDYLFRGHAESIADPERGLASLEESMRRRGSRLASLIHTDVLRAQVLDIPDLEKANRILRDVAALKDSFPGNAMVLRLSITVHTTCYHAFGALGQQELRQRARDEGLKDARALQGFATDVRAVVDRWTFLDETGQPEAGLADLRLASQAPGGSAAAFNLGYYLYRVGDFEQAAKALEVGKGETYNDLLRVIALAELPGGPARARKLHRDITARGLRGWDRFNSQLILRFLGLKDEAVKESQQFLGQRDHFPALGQEPFRRALEYCADERLEKRLIASAGDRRSLQSNAHLCIALTALADRDLAKARDHLELCERTGYYELPYAISKMLLSRMNRDRDGKWPSWITKPPR